MIKIKWIIPVLAISMLAACSPSSRKIDEQKLTDSSTVNTQQQSVKGLKARMEIAAAQSLDKPIEMTFTVYNQADSSQTFCKWHTPFEALMSKYLDITLADGKEVAYKGPMAKRIMPPPADSYVSVAAKDSLSIKVDLTKGYDFNAAGTYTIRYNSGNISGLSVTDSLIFTLK